MFEFLNEFEPLLKGFWYVALISSFIFIIQALLTFIGGSHDVDGLQADFDGNLDDSSGPFQLFSFRNLINFLLGFSWTGVVFYHTISSTFLLILIATIVGTLFLFLFFFLIKQILKLSEDNTFKIESLLHQNGQVYIPIPGNMAGRGKVQISIQGATHEIDAMTNDAERLNSGTLVQVEKIQENILIVTKIK